MSEFVSLFEPPGAMIDHYDRNRPHNQQMPGIPEKFLEVMSIREQVFVKEHGAPLHLEHDSLDSRSFHWIVYASVGTKRPRLSGASGASAGRDSVTSSTVSVAPLPGVRQHRQPSSDTTTANKLAVGCVRLIVPPFAPEPSDPNQRPLTYADNPNFPKSPEEPYIRFGRLAILKPFRGIGLSNLLLTGATDWASQNPDRIIPPLHPTIAEQRRIDGSGPGAQQPWQGLIVVHVMTTAVAFWADQGFVKDESMGCWMEDGLAHVGMWKRLSLRPREQTTSSSASSISNGNSGN